MSNTTTTTRIGPRMQEAVEYVRQSPGCAILPVAEMVGPNGSRRYGYATVHRAIKAGLIDAKVSVSGRYSLYPVRADVITELGMVAHNA